MTDNYFTESFLTEVEKIASKKLKKFKIIRKILAKVMEQFVQKYRQEGRFKISPKILKKRRGRRKRR